MRTTAITTAITESKVAVFFIAKLPAIFLVNNKLVVDSRVRVERGTHAHDGATNIGAMGTTAMTTGAKTKAAVFFIAQMAATFLLDIKLVVDSRIRVERGTHAHDGVTNIRTIMGTTAMTTDAEDKITVFLFIATNIRTIGTTAKSAGTESKIAMFLLLFIVQAIRGVLMLQGRRQQAAIGGIRKDGQQSGEKEERSVEDHHHNVANDVRVDSQWSKLYAKCVWKE
jgi:uncharacterized membrane protein